MKSILIVDDEIRLSQSFVFLLKRLGYHVDSVQSVSSAISALNQGSYDLVILDDYMPGDKGLELLPDLVSRGQELHVIVMTGHVTLDSAIKAAQYGVKDFLLKPVQPEKFIHRVRLALGDKVAGGESQAEVDEEFQHLLANLLKNRE